MEAYLLKTILCTAAFLGFYQLFLSNEKLSNFKRFYLLSTLCLSILIPFISINYGTTSGTSAPKMLSEIFINNAQKSKSQNFFQFQNLLVAMYSLGSLVMLLRFIFSIRKIYIKTKTGEKIPCQNFEIVLSDETATPHSFLKCIFLNKTEYFRENIHPQILRHEEAHLSQKHSLDVVFIEFLLIIFWTNPVLYLFKKAILTNHEFLADEAAVDRASVGDYQNLLLRELSSPQLRLENQLSYRNTKNRFIMMTKQTTKKSRFFAALSVPFAAAMLLIFSEKTAAQNMGKIPQNVAQNNNAIPLTTTKNTGNEADTSPEFPGGSAALRQKVAQEFNTAVLSAKSGLLKSEVNTYVDENGKTTNVNVDGTDADFTKETLRTVEKVTADAQWKPGTKNGKPVASALKMPITMSFTK